MDKQPTTYILASGRNGTLYIGVTSDLVGKVWQHREHLVEGFSRKHHVTMLVWFESHGSMEAAIVREKRLKKWNREWKIRMIEKGNPYWRNLWSEIAQQCGVAGSPPARG